MKEEFKFLSEEHPTSKIPRTLGQKTSDNLTKWAGSWAFIILFGFMLLSWILINSYWILFGRTWDPYPFILLNLVLSCLAAIQAPVILMSQNRQSQKDRIKAQYDYAVNVKAEKEVREIKKELNEIKRILEKKKY
ncbi:DUF1003 domain-containing protein [Candidatus Pacearchaeota archaeon]|nr:DUF1003 domain-containing protein [Candidatus Pacearchaeota archaeon]